MEILSIGETLIKNPLLIEGMGEWLYAKLKDKRAEISSEVTLQSCIDYLKDINLYRIHNGLIKQESIVDDNLAKRFPNIRFEELDFDPDHSGDIDYIGKVGNKAFGIQIKPITANSNFGNYNLSERMQANFEQFEEKYGGKVFIIFSSKVGNKKELKNKEVLEEIAAEIKRLTENK